MKKIIEVNHLSKSYGYWGARTKVLDNLSFSVEEGEFVGIMGPSGAGKTTLLNILSLITLPTQGTVRMYGKDLTQMNNNDLTDFRRENLGFIFQEFRLIDTLNVKDNILLPIAIQKLPYEEMAKRLKQVAAILGLADLLERFPAELSVGQKQRTAAARALIVHPKLILADEPTGSLDSKSASEFLHYLYDLNREEEMSILMVTHDPYTASYCNRVLFIKDGVIFSEIVKKGSRKEFFNKVIDMQATIGGGGAANAHKTGLV